MTLDIIQLISTLGGLASGLGLGMFTRSGRVKAQADAYKTMAESYEYRIAAANERIKLANETEAEHLKRISELNRALDDKTQRIRDLTDANIATEHEVNRVNDLLTAEQSRTAALERDIADLRVALERYKGWHCRHADCPDRIPPNPALKGQKYQEQ